MVMALQRHLIHERAAGSSDSGKDRWTLIVDTDTGAMLVQHERSHGNPDKPVSHGAKTISVDDFLKSEADVEVVERLGKLLSDLGWQS
jgi:hypothetical protein